MASASEAPADSKSSAASNSSSLPCARSSRTDGAAPRRGRVGRVAPPAEVLDPAAAAVLLRDEGDEARDGPLQLLQQHRPVRVRLGERVREQVEDELLVRLAARVDADVRERGGGQ